MASSMSRARLGAPPCSGPDSAPMAATIAAPRSAPVEVTTRAVKVDALNPWSMVSTMYCSMARAWAAVGSSPVEHVQVVGHEAEIGPRLNGLQAFTQTVGAGQNRRHDCAEREALLEQLVRPDVVGGAPRRAPNPTARPRCATRRAARRGGRSAGRSVCRPAGRLRRRRSAWRRRPTGRVGQHALEEEVPDVLEVPLLGQLHRRSTAR